MDKQFPQLRQTWDHLGEHDPLWAILSFPQKRGNRWQLERVHAIVRKAGGQVIQSEESNIAGEKWKSKVYFVRLRAE